MENDNEPTNLDTSLLTAVGGRPTLEKVHKILYDKLYADEWMGVFFHDIDQDVIEIQQTEFMIGAMGGPKIYCGKIPKRAHKHMMITEELFEYRQVILKESLREGGVPENLAIRWMKIDGAFKAALVKKDRSECEKRFNTDTILDYPKPEQLKKAA